MRAMAATFPAFVTDDLGTVAAQNELYTRLFGRVAGRPRREGNLFWGWFASGRLRRSVLNPPEHQESIGRNFVAYLRVVVAKRGYDVAAAALVADLCAASEEFLRMWDEHRVSSSPFPVLSVLDDRVGRLDFEGALMVNSRLGQRLYSLHAVTGTPTQQRLTALIVGSSAR